MKNQRICLRMLVLVFVFGMTVMGCDLLGEDEFKPETINGVWYLRGNEDIKTGSIISISNGEATLTAIGDDDTFTSYAKKGYINIGDTLIKNINYISNVNDSDVFTYLCETKLSWIDGYFHSDWQTRKMWYNIKDKHLVVNLMNADDVGMGISFIR